MAEYSVPIVNRFALSDLSEDEDLHELLEKQQAEKKRKEEQAAEAAAKAAAEAAAKAKSDRKGSAKAGSKKPARAHDNKAAQQSNTSSKPFRNDENKPPRFANRQPREGGENQNFEKPPQNDSGFGGGRGRRFGGGRGGGGRGRGGKREFDRHSGSDKTGVKAVEKREGNGPHNWGDQIEAQMEETPEAEPQNETITEADTTTEINDTQEQPESAEEDAAPKEMTLDEWKASKQAKAKSDFNVRKANEGADQKQWKASVALQKKKKGDLDDEDVEYIEEDLEDVEDTRATLEKLNIQITFADNGRQGPRMRGRGRGGFGSRGGRGRGNRFSSDRRSDGKGSVPRVDNESDFPTLGSR